MSTHRILATVTGIEHFLTQFGAKVHCDECGGEYDVGRKWKDALERARLAFALRVHGWRVDGDHDRHICPECLTGDPAVMARTVGTTLASVDRRIDGPLPIGVTITCPCGQSFGPGPMYVHHRCDPIKAPAT